MALQPIVETCVARSDILDGGLTDAHFAAQLDQVVRAPETYEAYGDPATFFDITYPTRGLRQLLVSTFGRLSGRGGDVEGAEHGVVRFQTSFGGGKTHGLIAAYHLASGARPHNLEEFMDPELLPTTCAVAAVVGDALDPLDGLEVRGQQVKTMWGAIAAQLGPEAWTALSEHDAERTAPGKQAWTDLFEVTPTLVVIDELANHMRALAASGNEDVRRQGKAMPAFLFNLCSAAAEVPTARVVITLATDRDAFGTETTEVEHILEGSPETTREVVSVVNRYREVLVPAEDAEISEILRRRLFATIDAGAAEAAGTAFLDFYAVLQQRDIRLEAGSDVATRVQTAYPFHPELVQVVDARIGTIPAFQRTRGALRLLAEAVARMWTVSSDAVIINLADLPLEAPAVTDSLTRGIGREAMSSVVAADITGVSAHARTIDQTRFSGTTPFASRVSTTVFLHSLEQTVQTGATLPDVWRGTLIPGDDPDLVEEALQQIEQVAWHFDYDGARYRFQTEPNPRKIVEDEKAAVSLSMVREELDRRIGVMFAPHGPIKTSIFPNSPADLEDRPQLRLAVMHYDNVSVHPKSVTPPPFELVDCLNTYGVSGGNRTHRNGLVFLVADADQIEGMRQAIHYDLAAQQIVADPDRMHAYVAEVQQKLTDICDKAGLDARVATTRCYRHLYYPKTDAANDHLRHHEITPRHQGEQESNQTTVVQQVLEGLDKIRTSALSTDFLASVSGFPKTGPLATSQIQAAFWRDHDAAIVLNPTLITDAVMAGIRNGTWVYYDAGARRAYDAKTPPPAPQLSDATWLYTRSQAEKEGLLGRDPTWTDVESVLAQARGIVDGPTLRAALEQALGTEPTKTSVLQVLARVVQQEDPPIVIVEGAPTKDSRPLSQSAVSTGSLDRLTVLTSERAARIGIVVGPKKPRGWQEQENGPAGRVFAVLADTLAERGEQARIHQVEIALIVTAGATSELQTLLAAPGMLPRHQFSISFETSASFAGLEGDVTASNLRGATADFQRVQKVLFDLFGQAEELTAHVILQYAPDAPIAPTADAWQQLAGVLGDLKPGVITVTVSGR